MQSIQETLIRAEKDWDEFENLTFMSREKAKADDAIDTYIDSSYTKSVRALGRY